eukprot:CAMPEP_0203696046 /NCGR_PEP_ID=MMETSP0091-20130426/7353_1 /ASSEMBLY_ACC=CAM_ASM_001089 /TAXON_ID=426623 /ORGANISM="Chaetoceros affinis, Strain CCMP159" /LENGTH=387 /DNA_ID=CAMNT_0050567747 /DNA_START=94 /DNA_END=1254 /DNA_ORIENTATION=-
MAILEQRKKNSNGGSNGGSNSGNTTSNNTSTSLTSNGGLSNKNNISGDGDVIQIRIKPNVQNSRNNYQDVTLSIPLSSTVYQLKEKIRSSCYNSSNNSNNNNSSSSSSNNNGNDNSASNTSDDGNSNAMNICNKNNDSSSSSNKNINTPTIANLTTISRDRYLRLICSGRLLAPDSTALSDLKCIKDGSVVHAILAAPGVRGGQQATLSRDRRHSSQRRLRGTGIGSNGLILPRRNNDEDDDDGEDIEEGRQRMGFDRLRANGMSRSEIIAIRAYFSRQVDRFIEQRNQLENNSNSNTNTSNNSSNNNGNEDPRIQRLRMEEEWMERQGPYSEFRLNINSSNPLLRSRAYINGIEIDTTTADGMNEFRSGRGASIIGALGTNRDFVW